MKNFYYEEEELNTEPDRPGTDDIAEEDNDSLREGDYPDETEEYDYSGEGRRRAAASRSRRAGKVRAEKVLLIVLGCAVGVLAAVYIGGCVYFSDHFGFHTTLNGSDVSLMTETQVADKLSDAASGYTLTITGRNNVTDTITGSDISLKPAYGDAIAALIRSQDHLKWPETLFRQTDLSSDATAEWDEDKLSAVIDDLAFFDPSNVIRPTDAGYTLTSDGYEIVPEDNGAEPVKEAVAQTIRTALDGFLPSVTLGDDCYETASITSDNETLTASVTELNKLAGITVTIPFGDETETLDGTTLGTWIVNADGVPIDAENGTTDGMTGSLSFDEAKVAEYVESLGDKYDTYGKDRSFTTTGGKTITVSGGNYGWVMDRDATTSALLEFLNSGSGGEFNVTWTQEAAQHGDDDIGSSYCEVDLDEQHVYIYVDGKCVVSTDCVSGKAIDPNRITPDGTYSLLYRKSPATLVGEGYESPVTYWMPFNRGIGFHDATWRSSFGGEIYLTNGSHGCVNLPLDAAKEVYANVYSGMPVVVYGGMTSEEAQEYTGQHPEVAAAAAETEDSSVTEGTADEDTQKAQEEAVIAQAVQNYVDLGMSQEEAAAKVQQDLASQAAEQLAAQQAAAAAAQQAAQGSSDEAQQAADAAAQAQQQAAAPAQ